MVDRAQFRQGVLAEVRRDPTVPVRRVYNAEFVRVRRQAQQVGDRDRPQIPGFNAIRTSMQRSRSDEMPPIPGTAEEVVIGGPWAQTWAQERFILHADNDWGHNSICNRRQLAKASTMQNHLYGWHL